MSNWYHSMFRIERPDPADPRWWIDLFIFDNVVRDCIALNALKLITWRIHRRNGGGEAGHQFSFLYYTSRDVFKEIASSIEEHRVVEILQSAN